MTNNQLQQIVNNINVLGDFLSQRDVPLLSREALQKTYGCSQADLLILFGGSILHGCEMAGKAYKEGIAKQLMIVGGIGHTTSYLRTAVSLKYPTIETAGKSEAEMIVDLFEQHFGISKDEMIVESGSTNCGENATFALQVCIKHQLQPKTVILMQDSSMQLRMAATFQKEWTLWPVTFIGYAAYKCKVMVQEERLVFEDSTILGMWEMEQYITLLLGEIPRLHDTEEGYGPKGKGYIAHVDMSDVVVGVFAELKNIYGELVRKPWAEGK